MIIRKAYKFKLEPTVDQAEKLRLLCGHARFVWNNALSYTIRILDQTGKVPSAYDLNKLIPLWKVAPASAFLKEANAVSLQQKLGDLSSAWKRYFDKSLQADKPRFKKKGKSKDSIRIVQFDKLLDVNYLDRFTTITMAG